MESLLGENVKMEAEKSNREKRRESRLKCVELRGMKGSCDTLNK